MYVCMYIPCFTLELIQRRGRRRRRSRRRRSRSRRRLIRVIWTRTSQIDVGEEGGAGYVRTSRSGFGFGVVWCGGVWFHGSFISHSFDLSVRLRS